MSAVPPASSTVSDSSATSVEPLRSELLPGTRIRTRLCANSEAASIYVAHEVAALVRQCAAAGRPAVLGLPTGSTPIGIYRELIRMHREEGLDFRHVVTFNLDEYVPMAPDGLQSYHRWMHENFFHHVNIPAEQIHIPQGDLPRREIESHCRQYEQAITDAGGIDLQLLGIGRTGHIGFNEPGSSQSSLTRLVTLDPVTRKDAASDFFGEESVPPRAITMGIGSILAAKRVIVLALGEHKAKVVRRSLEEPETTEIAASFLQSHPEAEFVLDPAAAARLTAVRTPWATGCVDWTLPAELRAVIWLSQQTNKPIHKLEARDFLEHHLTDLVHESGPVQAIRQRAYEHLNSTICHQPGGTTPQTVIVFSPHPDDDVISMGGTLITLAEQGHDVHIAYMTSGNIAVFDHDALRHVEFVSEFLEVFQLQTAATCQRLAEIHQQVELKKRGAHDLADSLAVKGLIRKTEAITAARTAGVPARKCHFLDLPFYQTGEVRKRPIGPGDVQIVAKLLRQLKPGQVYLAGDLSDPHGTHRMCAQAILAALAEVQTESLTPEVWMYRGAWQEYEPHEIDRAVPLSPETMLQKKLAIFRHESQKDAALFPGHDEREFWV
ncbi:MAG: glucosamine-6-phosphate deaminase, partial [Planctomycetaceae bacterium]